MTELAKRRRALLQQISGGMDPSVEIVQNCYLDNRVSGYVTQLENAGYTEDLEGANGNTIVYCNPISSLASNNMLGRILRFKTNNFSSYQGYSTCYFDGTEHQFTTTINQRYFYINVDLRKVNQSYCYNATTGKVYYAGRKTPYYGKNNINE